MNEFVLKSSTSFGIMLQQSEKEVVLTLLILVVCCEILKPFQELLAQRFHPIIFQRQFVEANLRVKLLFW